MIHGEIHAAWSDSVDIVYQDETDTMLLETRCHEVQSGDKYDRQGKIMTLPQTETDRHRHKHTRHR